MCFCCFICTTAVRYYKVDSKVKLSHENHWINGCLWEASLMLLAMHWCDLCGVGKTNTKSNSHSKTYEKMWASNFFLIKIKINVSNQMNFWIKKFFPRTKRLQVDCIQNFFFTLSRFHCRIKYFSFAVYLNETVLHKWTAMINCHWFLTKWFAVNYFSCNRLRI